MRSWKKYFLIVLMAMTAGMIAVFAWLILQYFLDPLDLIKRPVGQITGSSDSLFSEDFLPAKRQYHRIMLQTKAIGPIAVIASFPDDISSQKLPVVIILGGLEVGAYTLRYIPAPANNVIIIYHYPYHPTYWYQGSALTEIPVIRESVMKVPAQIVTLYQWIGTQEWAEKKRITVTGYSFGALFVPAVFRLADYHQIPISIGVMAYGGANIYDLLVTNMTQVARPFRSLIAWVAFSAIRGIEPALHAPFLNGDFLLINGRRDHQITEENWRKLHQLIPQPKTIIILDEGHMHQRNEELTRRLVRLSQQWLVNRHVINP